MPANTMNRLIFFLLSLFFTYTLAGQIITTVAGNGTYGSSGNGGAATMAQLTSPMGIVTDKSGNLYITDQSSYVIRKVDAITGIISIYAGTGVIGYSGDGEPAILAQLYHPSWMGIDNEDNIYFVDHHGEYIRRIDAITTVIMTVAVLNPNGDTGDGVHISAAQFKSFTGITFDANNNMYISDGRNHVIKKVTPEGIVSNAVGNGTSGNSGDGGAAIQAQISSPYHIAFDSDGNMYFADNENQQIKKVNTAGIISTFAGSGSRGYSGDGGPAVNATLLYPWTIDIDDQNNLYIGDAGNNLVRLVTTDGMITTYAGTGNYGHSGDGGPARLADLAEITTVHIDRQNNLLISVRSNSYSIRKVTNCTLTPISVLQHPDNFILCNNGNAEFRLDANNVLTFKWQIKNGSNWNDISDNSTYQGTTSNTLFVANITPIMNGQQYRCVMTGSCGVLFSRTVTLTVTTPQVPALVINGSGQNICKGMPVSFTATPQHGGNLPAYQWTKNGTNTGTDNNTYTDNDLKDGDIIQCTLTSNDGCITSSTVLSNTLTMRVAAKVTPTLTISSSINDICAGTPVTFSSTGIHTGANPAYTWLKNGLPVGSNADSFTDNQLKEGDIISCRLQSDLSCVTNTSAMSNTIVMQVKPLRTPSLVITTPDNSICENESMSFTAAAQYGGTNPAYQWLKNGAPVGTDNPSFTTSDIQQSDIITCKLTSNESCLTQTNIISNSITAIVHANPIVVLDKNNTICAGGSRVLDAGNYSSYTWNNGSGNRRITVYNEGQYGVTVTDKNGCKGSDNVIINTTLPSPASFLPADTSICNYGDLLIRPLTGFVDYLWSNGSRSNILTINQAGQYWLQATSNNGCTGKDSITVLPKACLQGFFMPTAFTPNNDNKNDLLKPILLGNVKAYQFWIYDRWGQLMYYSKDYTQGWNGTFKGSEKDSQALVWMCTYQLEGEPVQHKKGTVVLLK